MGTQESSDMLGEQLHNYNPVKYGRATCLPHKGGGIPLSALPKDTTSKLAGLSSTLSLFMLSAKQGSCEYHFLKSFSMTRLWNEPQVYRLQCGRSNHCTIAPVKRLTVVGAVTSCEKPLARHMSHSSSRDLRMKIL